MDKIIKNILKKIENEGYEAYIIGGYVRDTLLHKISYDVDICTNALPKDLQSIFLTHIHSNNYGGINLLCQKYNIDITTYRKDANYKDGRHPSEVIYINNLFEDIKRRDFTVNALCMDKNENIIDLLESKKDLDQKIIKSIGEPNQKFQEDNLRMLRAIRFATVLDFSIEANTYQAIKDNYLLVNNISKKRIKEELSKILASPNYEKGLTLLKETKIADVLELNYDIINYTSDLMGMWAQISCPKVEFSKTEKDTIDKIHKVLITKKIDNYNLFTYGLYICTVAADIMNIDIKQINKNYKKLPIKSINEIDINGQEIMELLNLQPSKEISEIISKLKIKILNNELKNNKKEIKNYLLKEYNNEQG